MNLDDIADTGEPSDEELLRRLVQGDERAFTHLVCRYESELLSYLRRMLGDVHAAEDVLQQSWMNVFRKCGSFQDTRRLRPWLFALVTNEARSFLRSRGRARRHVVPVSLLEDGAGDSAHDGHCPDLSSFVFADPHARDPAHDQDESEDVRSALGALAPVYQEIIHLTYYQGLKYREAAEVLRVPLGTVKSRVHGAVAQLGVEMRKVA